MERVLRKKRSDLILSGVGTILLGGWAFVRVILSILFAANYVNRVFDFDSFAPALKPITLFLWVLIGFFGMLLYLYVGTRAVREGKTGKRQRGYLLPAAVLLAVNVLLFFLNLLAFSETQADVLDLIGELLLGLARAANFAMLLHAAWQTRKLSRNSEREAISHAD